jgi:methyl-accepting chemotaxis protein
LQGLDHRNIRFHNAEAARAEETRAAFAEAADEVRNLAMRAAEAAKNTFGLIEGPSAE